MNEAPSEGRNLVVCFDGTNYEFDREPTNVVRLSQVLGRNHSKRQLLYYDPGGGTLPEPGILIPMLKTVTRWFGLAFVLDLPHQMAQAYTNLRRSTRANGKSCAMISAIHSLARSNQETMNGGFKCISWAFGTRCHPLGGYGIRNISLSQPIIRASNTSATPSP